MTRAGPDRGVSLQITPILEACPVLRARAQTFGWKLRSRMICQIRFRVSSPTPGRPLTTLETVCDETPAALATSRIPTRRCTPGVRIGGGRDEFTFTLPTLG